MDQDEERVLFVLVEIGRERDHAVNALAAGAGGPKVPEREPVDLGSARGVERSERLRAASGRIDAHDLRRIGGALPIGKEEGGGGFGGDGEVRVTSQFLWEGLA